MDITNKEQLSYAFLSGMPMRRKSWPEGHFIFSDMEYERIRANGNFLWALNAQCNKVWLYGQVRKQDWEYLDEDTVMKTAVWVDCPGLKEGRDAHYMRDFCSTCAPFWEKIPLCPDCRCKMKRYGRTKCKKCNKFVIVEPEGMKEAMENELHDVR